MRYGTVCSGIEAPTVAWDPLGWEPVWFSEIDPFPKAVLAHHYPGVPNLGDLSKVNWNDAEEIDLLCGGTPCQSFSVAGLRKGLADPRGNLALEFLRVVDARRPRWVVWENVSGVLSSNGGRDFGTFLGALAKLGYGFAWRVLDAQYFGVPQRRRRVFLVASPRGWAGPAAVLLERQSLRRDPAPSREAGPAVAALTARGVGTCGADDNRAQAGHLIAHTLRGRGVDASEDGTGRGTPIVCSDVAPTVTSAGPPYSRTWNSRVEADALVLSSGQANAELTADIAPTLNLNRDGAPIAFHLRQDPISGPVAQPCEAKGPGGTDYPRPRRLTPVECERLQGFPDNYTRIPWGRKTEEDCPLGPRYKALGNSMAVPVVRWIGERIQFVDDLIQAERKRK